MKTVEGEYYYNRYREGERIKVYVTDYYDKNDELLDREYTLSSPLD